MIVKIGNHGRTGEGRIRIKSLISKGHGSDGTKKKEGFLLEFFFLTFLIKKSPSITREKLVKREFRK